AKKAHRIITVSQTTRNDLLDWMPSLESKVQVIYNRLDQDCFEPAPAIDPGSLGIAKEFILYVGNFKKHKGLDTLIDAYSKDTRLPQLVLVGSGSNMDHDLSERILSIRNLRMLGFAGPEILRALYSRALLFVFPSRYEGFGYPPLEAMAAGCPVLSSDAPAMKEILGDGAEFFRCGDAEELLAKLQSLLSDGVRRQALTESGALQARKFATDESSRKIVELWGQIGAMNRAPTNIL
ncbi:MAG: glycosyltransferase family 4 protein, partial [Acidobacteriota bacterium]